MDKVNVNNNNVNSNVMYNNSLLNSGNEMIQSNADLRNSTLVQNSPYQLKLFEQQKKKALFENLQSQLKLYRDNKLKEKQKKIEEEQKHLKEMINSFPFGRGGGGAPIRDKSGNIITTRRALISDPKYNLMQINVDDDYNDVWGKDKTYGLVNFKNRTIKMDNYYNENNNNNINEVNEIYVNNGQNIINNNNNHSLNRSQSVLNIRNNRYSPYNNFINNASNVNNQFMNTLNRSCSTARMINDINNNTMMNPMSMSQQVPLQLGNNNLYQCENCGYSPDDGNMVNIVPQGSFNKNIQSPNAYNQFVSDVKTSPSQINLSYDNYELSEDQKKRNKDMYKNDLLAQIKEKQLRHALSEKIRIEEEKRDEERVRIQNEEIKKSLEEERDRQKDDPNNKLNNQSSPEVTTTVIKKPEKSISEQMKEEGIPTNLSPEQQSKLQKIKEQEIESRMTLNNELLKLKEQMQEQQVNLMTKINVLQQETKEANLQRFAALKEIEKLKFELEQQRGDEEARKKYVYDILGYDGEKLTNQFSEEHMADAVIDNALINSSEFLLNRSAQKKPVQRYIPLSSFNILDKTKDESKAQSSYLDLNSHYFVDNPDICNNDNTNTKEQAIEVEDNFGTLEPNSNYSETKNKHEIAGNEIGLYGEIEHNDQESEVNVKDDFLNLNQRFHKDVEKQIKTQIDSLNTHNLEVNQIYNKNLARLRVLNNMESKLNDYKKLQGYNPLTIEGKLRNNYDSFIKKYY